MVEVHRKPEVIHREASEPYPRTSGPFWQDDNYDTLIRSEGHLETATKYVLENPMKAGLHDWPWIGHHR